MTSSVINPRTAAMIVAMRCLLRLARSRVSPLTRLRAALRVRREGVHLGSVGLGAADGPLAAHPAQAKVAAAADGQIGMAGEADLGEVRIDLLVQAGGVDRANVVGD